jgi:hypothetical protein
MFVFEGVMRLRRTVVSLKFECGTFSSPYSLPYRLRIRGLCGLKGVYHLVMISIQF